jgi:glycosyltransferase involved in cell wall biosynthesis
MAQVNAQMRDALAQSGARLSTFDLAAKSLERTTGARLKRILRIASVLTPFVTEVVRARGSVLYVGLSGGWGLAYEICFVAWARLWGFSIFLHHHSFAYLQARTGLMRILVWAAGRDARHIALCGRMADLLRHHYGADAIVQVISNAAVIASPSNTPVNERVALRSLGFLSNISREKGVFLFIDIAEELQRRGATVIGKIAGPFQDEVVKTEVLARISQSTCLEYVGPQYGEDKTRFFDSIDTLIFPSRYANEAEPLTVHEAMSRALPVLSLDRGCIAAIVPSTAGSVLADGDDVVRRAADVLAEWWHNPELVREKSRNARAANLQLRQAHLDSFAALCREMASS